MFGEFQTACGYTPEQIREIELPDVFRTLAHWRKWPPAHRILKSAFRVQNKSASEAARSADDPSGIGGLIAAFPDGKVPTAR